MGRWVVAWCAVAFLCACGGRMPVAPAPIAPPTIASPEVDAGGMDLAATEPNGIPFLEPGPLVQDDILASPIARDPDFQREVERWLSFWGTSGARWFPDYLRRMSWFSSAVDSALSTRGLPPSLRYLPIIESGYSPRAVSPVRAVGLWQFMASTAQGYGMSVGPLLDERRDPFQSSAAAGDYLAQLHDQFGSWFLALAAYNSGPNRVQRLVDQYAPLAPPSDSLYWVIRQHLPRETRDFVPKFYAAVLVAQNPEAYGITVPTDSVGFDFDEVDVPDATTLDVVAQAAETPQTEIERLNPEVVHGITPPARSTTLRVPVGKGWVFAENYAKIPPSDRVTFVEHRISRGETLSHVAHRYGVPLNDLRAANPEVNPRRLQIGQRIIVPVAPRANGN